jgi:signal transduction histidine kinase
VKITRVGRSPRVVGRASLLLIALLALATMLLAIHRPSLASIAAAVAAPVYVVVPFVGAYVAQRRPSNPVGWIFLASGVALGVFAFSASYAYAVFTEGDTGLPAAPAFGWLASWTWVYTVPLIGSFGVLLFPDGHVSGRRRRRLAWLSGLMLASLTLGRAFAPQYSDWAKANPLAAPWGLASLASGLQDVGLPLLFPVTTLTAVSLAVRARRASAELRPTMRLATATAFLVGLSYLGCIVWSEAGGNTIWLAAFQAVPVVALAVVTTIGIVRHGLFDLRVALNRTLVYGSLTLLVLGLYIGLSAVLGLLVGGVASDLLAGAGVALAALPLRDRLQRSVNRMLYGDRDDPYSAISRLSEQLDAVAETRDALPAVARTVSESLRLPYVAIELGGEVAASSGMRSDGELQELPLTFQGERLGRLLCETRAAGVRFGTADRRLLRELARHVAVAGREVLLRRDLMRSREQIVRFREEERRRIRRELHDGVGPNLAGIALGIDRAGRCEAIRTPRSARCSTCAARHTSPSPRSGVLRTTCARPRSTNSGWSVRSGSRRSEWVATSKLRRRSRTCRRRPRSPPTASSSRRSPTRRATHRPPTAASASRSTVACAWRSRTTASACPTTTRQV